jgi:predicted GNAT superfamily acetyltransferase
MILLSNHIRALQHLLAAEGDHSIQVERFDYERQSYFYEDALVECRTGISPEEKGYFLTLKHSKKVPVAKLEWIDDE